LTLARADAGNPGLRLQAVRLDEVVIDSVGLLKVLAAEKEITLTADVSPAVVNGDADSLGQLVSNLVSNAIQHNHPGVGKVHVRLERKPVRGDFRAVLTVSDNGPGIAEEDRPRIFQRFFRVDKARARASGGNGLGLAICKAIADAHSARIDFTSSLGKGTEFHVVFPPLPGTDDQIKVLEGKRPPHGKRSV
jgi:two-component system sensor histidine kinase VicK